MSRSVDETAETPRSPDLAGRQTARERLQQTVPALLAGAVVAWLALNDGGYFPTSWGPVSIALLGAASVAIASSSRISPSPRQVALVAAVSAFAVWIAVSAAWSDAPWKAPLEFERALVYVSIASAMLVVLRPRSVPGLLAALLATITAVAAYSLATRLFPDRLGGYDPIGEYRLSHPLGYWNALGIFTVFGLLLAAGFAGFSRRVVARALAAGAAVVLTATLYFAFSRGAWAALAAGLLATAIVHRERLRLIATVVSLVPACGVAVWLASRSEPLTQAGSAVADAARDGQRLAVYTGLCVGLAALATVVLSRAEARLAPGRHRLLAASAIAVLSVAAFGSFASEQASSSGFEPDTPDASETQTGPLNERLFDASSNGRAGFWRVAWSEYQSRPWLGSGAGTFERYWFERRDGEGQYVKARDAHNLYLETLAELGPVGLLLLLAALAVPITAMSLRASPLLASAFGAYVAFVVHAAVDFDWEMTAVGAVAFFLAAALCATRSSTRSTRRLPVAARIGAIAVLVPLVAVAAVGVAASTAVAEAARATAARDWDAAAPEARRASAWRPGSPEPSSWLGEIRLARGERAAAAARFRAALGRDDGDWARWFDLARATDGRERQRALARASALNPLSPEIRAFRDALEDERFRVEPADPSPAPPRAIRDGRRLVWSLPVVDELWSDRAPLCHAGKETVFARMQVMLVHVGHGDTFGRCK